MRRVVLDEYLKENRAGFTRARLALEHGRSPLRRARSGEEKEVLLRLDRSRRERWLAEGKLEILGPRRYRLRILPE